MNTPGNIDAAADLLTILQNTTAVLEDETTLDQQRVFVRHIQNIAEPMQAPFDAVATSPYPWLRIPLRDACATPVQTVVGYAKMLLERPEQFGVTSLSPHHVAHFQSIHATAVEIHGWLHALDGFENHREWSRAAAQIVGLDGLMEPLLTVLRYHLRDRVALEAAIFGTDQRIHANPYHVAQIIQHLVFSTTRELDDVRQISAVLRQSPQHVALEFSVDSGVFDQEALTILFERQGSRHYRENLMKQGAVISSQSSTLHLQWPRMA
jgi:uncharacterized protein YkuJ